MASGTSKKIELKLTNVARASLEELMRDYEDFLRQRNLPLWDMSSPQALAVRRRLQSSVSALSDLECAKPETAANTLLCLINQASYLLHRQLKRLEWDFLQHGGFTERLHATRIRAGQLQPSDRSDWSDLSHTPACPTCGKPMRLRTAMRGTHAGQPFWGCSGYPECNGTRRAHKPT